MSEIFFGLNWYGFDIAVEVLSGLVLRKFGF